MAILPSTHRWRSLRIGLTLIILAASMIGVVSTHAASTCTVAYTIVNQWSSGFQGDITITNSAAAISSWTLAYSFPNGQVITQLWNGTVAQTGANVSVTNLSWNGSIATGGSVNLGFLANWSGANGAPSVFTLNGAACSTGGGPTPTGTAAATRTNTPTTSATAAATRTSTPISTGTITASPTRTNTPINTPTATATRTGTPTNTPINTPTATPPPAGTHLDNPFIGARGYINPDYAAQVQAAAAAKGGTLGTQMAKIAGYSTAVWLDRIAAIAGTTSARGLQSHLDAALAQQQSSGTPVIATFVIYDLPNRDCSALASNSELLIANGGLNTYKTQYIDPIAALLSAPKYSSLRIATIIEPDSLPNLITNLSFAKCSEANSTGAYEQGVAYALTKLHAISNVYTYVDIAHSGWLGWDTNFTPMVNLLVKVAGQTSAGVASIDGFISNTANTLPISEPFMTANQQISNNPVRSANFYQWNQYIDEATYSIGMRNALIAQGFPSSIGMLIDTSRNGWGGAARPAGASTSTDLNTFVNASKIDRRIHRGNWCNQNGAGIGARPAAAPAAGFDAYVWIKPPGESDGASQVIPNDEGKGFDRMCDPTYTGNSLNGNNLTNALPNAPLAGKWFEAQFEQLVQNAFPSL